MVVLVRCIDNTVTVALESNLGQLIKDGLITAFLHTGEWIDTVNRQPGRTKHKALLSESRLTAFVSCF